MAETTDNTTQQTASAANAALAALGVTLALGGLVAFYSLSSFAPWQRWVALGLGLVLGVTVFAVSAYGRLTWAYIEGSRVELRKMVWPTKDETWKTTLIVFGFVAAMGLFFWMIDSILGWATRRLLGGGA
jgi:preprotein translocase subunit SecE